MKLMEARNIANLIYDCTYLYIYYHVLGGHRSSETSQQGLVNLIQ